MDTKYILNYLKELTKLILWVIWKIVSNIWDAIVYSSNNFHLAATRLSSKKDSKEIETKEVEDEGKSTKGTDLYAGRHISKDGDEYLLPETEDGKLKMKRARLVYSHRKEVEE